MFHSIRKHTSTVATIGIASALAVGGVAVAQNDSGSGQGKPQGPPQGLRAPPPPGGPMARNLTYAEFHVQRNGQAEVIRMDRGEVVSVSPDSITVLENDGNEVTIPVDESTKVLAGPGRDTAVTDLETGRQVLVCGPEGGTAKAILVPPKKGQAPRGPQGSQQSGQLPPAPGAQMRG